MPWHDVAVGVIALRADRVKPKKERAGRVKASDATKNLADGLRRFAADRANLSLPNFEAACKYCGLRLVKTKGGVT